MIFLASLLFLAIIAAATYLATDRVLRHLLAARILDAPNARSSHDRPTPRGGGIGLLATIIPAIIVIGPIADGMEKAFYLLVGTGFLAAISFLDDLRSRSALLRFGVQILAIMLGLLALGDGLVFQGILPFPLDRALAAFLWLWFVNLYNFMDGIDGITAVETMTIGLGVALIGLVHQGLAFEGLTGLALAGAALGFLPHNWHRARVFLGDVGSIPLGFLAGYLLLALAAQGLWAAALALPLYYLFDATFTLLRRLLRGEKIWQAHRQHLYQGAATISGHRRTVLTIAFANAGLLASASLGSTFGPFLLVPALLILALLVARLHALATSG